MSVSKAEREKQQKPHKTRSRRVGDRFDRPYACSITHCDKTFTRVEHLRRHQLNHLSTPKWICTTCRAAFVRSDLWRRHCWVTHGQSSPTSSTSLGSQGTKSSLAPSTRHSLKHAEGLSTKALPLGAEVDNQTVKIPLCSLAQEPASAEPVQLDLVGVDHNIDVEFERSLSTSTSARRGSSPRRIAPDEDVETIQDQPGHPNQQVPSFDLQRPHVRRLGAFNADFGLDFRHTSLTTATDLAWLFDGPLLDYVDDDTFPFDNHNPNPREDGAVFSGIVGDLHYSPTGCCSSEPVFAAPTREPEPQAPNCGFRVCNALTEERRAELLTCLKQDMPGLDMSSPIFSLNNMKMGVHLYARDVSKQAPIFHHQVLAPITEEDKRDVKIVYGGEAPYQLSWAIITLGWSLWNFHGGRDAQMAVEIQRVLRRSIINHPAFTLDPPIWVVQTLFLILMFARYCGSKEDHAASVVFHGVLIDAVRRLDRIGKSHHIPDLNKSKPCRHEWFNWIHIETVKRLVVHTFILDVQHVILHGGDMCMSPFELSLQLPYSEAVWCADSVEEWAAEMKKTCTEPALFLTMLKQFWNVSCSIDRLPQACPGDSRVILYGIMSIARDMKRRDDNTFSVRPKDSLSVLNAKVLKSFESWVSWWERNRAPLGLEVYLWRNCSCMLRLAYTLYEIGPVELQAAAGKDVVEGKRIGTSEYARARRKIRVWAREERALLAVSKAASIIHDRLSPSYVSRAHCYQCNWALYLAGLICWNFSFATTGGVSGDSTTQGGLGRAGGVILASAGFTHSHRSEYLLALLDLPQTGLKDHEVMEQIRKTSGLPLVLVEILEPDGGGLVSESIELLKRLMA